MLNKTFFIKNQYLSNCDLINKYNLKNIYQKPKLNKIILEFSLKNFIEALNSKENQEKLNETQIKAFLFIYLLIASVPFINNKVKMIKNKEIKETTNYSLKFIYSKDIYIYNFLFYFFIENWFFIVKENKNIFLLEDLNFSTNNLNHNLLNLKTILPVSVFSDMEYIMSNSNFDLNSKELNININYLINSPKKLKNLNSLIKNLPLFWISG